MAYSKVSLLCALLAFLLISNGVSARLLDSVSGVAGINMDDLVEEQKKDAAAANGNSASASAAAGAQLPSGKSIIVGLAPAPAPAQASQISETGKTDEVFDEETFSSFWADANDMDEGDADANTGSDEAFEPNGMDEEGTEDDDDIPLP